MPITDTWDQWSTTANNNPPAGSAIPLMDDEIRNIKAEVRKNTLEPGTKAPFYQAAAPMGWTQDTNINDKVLRVVSTAGGGTGGNWTLSGMAVDSHILTKSELPANLHGWSYWGYASTTPSAANAVVYGDGGGGQGHTHGLTNTSWRPAYIDMIVCEKD